MKTVRHLLTGVALALAVLGAGVTSASTVSGNVTLIAPGNEVFHDGGVSITFSVIINGTCDGDGTVKDRSIHIRSGHMVNWGTEPPDARFAHRGVNMRNVYSTLLSALLSGRRVDIGTPDCSDHAYIDLAGGAAVNINLLY